MVEDYKDVWFTTHLKETFDLAPIEKPMRELRVDNLLRRK